MVKKDNRNLYGGQYRMSDELAEAINKNLKFGNQYAHNMSAYENMNHFDVHRMLINENINKKKLMEIDEGISRGDPTLWNTKREDVLLDGVVKLGKKYKVPLKRPLRIDAYGNIILEVKQK